MKDTNPPLGVIGFSVVDGQIFMGLLTTYEI